MKFLSVLLICFGGAFCTMWITATIGIMLIVLGQMVEDYPKEMEREQ